MSFPNLHSSPDTYPINSVLKKKKKKTENEIASVVQDVEELKSSYSADGNDGLKCCSHYGKLFGHPTEY